MTNYQKVGWLDGTGPTTYPGLVHMDEQIYTLSQGQINVKDFGALTSAEAADSDSVANTNAAAFTAWANALNTAGGGIGVIPPGRYYTKPPIGSYLCNFNSVDGLYILAHGTHIYDSRKDTGYGTGLTSGFIKFNASKRVKVLGPLYVESEISPTFALPYNGLIVMVVEQGCEDVEAEVKTSGCAKGFSAVRANTDPESYHSKRLRVRVSTENTFYPFSLERTGRGVDAEIEAVSSSRCFTIYNAKNVKIKARVKNHHSSSLIASYDALGVENVDIDYYNRESDWGSGEPIHIRYDTSTPTTHRNIKLKLDIKNPVGTPWPNNNVLISKWVDTNAPTPVTDTVGRGHVMDGLDISGTSEQRDENYYHLNCGVQGAFASPDVFRNVHLHDLLLQGLGDSYMAMPIQGVSMVSNVTSTSGDFWVENPSGNVVFVGCEADSFGALNSTLHTYIRCKASNPAVQSLQNKEWFACSGAAGLTALKAGEANGAILDGILVGSATYDPPSTATGATWTTTLTVTGAAVGDFVTAINHSSITSGDWQLYGYVSAADTVRVYGRNNTGGTVDLASGSLRACVVAG